MPSEMAIICPQCGQLSFKAAGSVNRSRAKCAPVYCSRVCSGLARRKPEKSTEQRKADKAAYDREYRKRDTEALRARKAAYYAASHDREKEREKRKRRMPSHVEYCRRPEYKEYKRGYDKRYRAEKNYGPFACAGLILLKLQEEINSRSTWLERNTDKGTLGKSQRRKREYAKRSIQETIRSEPERCVVGYPASNSKGSASASRGRRDRRAGS